eukprot:10751688-Ditylum_brightwellii.AAC.1
MMSIPWLAGFTPLRWERGIDCMLEKDPGNPWLYKLRLAALHNLCPGVKLFSVCQNRKVERVADAYANDTGNTYVNEEKQSDETPEIIRDSLRHIAVT